MAHGGPGEIDLGKGDDLRLATMPDQVATLERLRSVFTSHARLNVYACDSADGPGGKKLVDDLAVVTGATVYASDNLVGTVPGADLFWNTTRASGYEQRAVVGQRPGDHSKTMPAEHADGHESGHDQQSGADEVEHHGYNELERVIRRDLL